MVADDAARRRCGPAPLRAALERLSDAVEGTADDRQRRLDRLDRDDRSLALSVLVVTLAICLVVLPTVILVVPWLDQAMAAWPF
jgi:hypothetical protein